MDAMPPNDRNMDPTIPELAREVEHEFNTDNVNSSASSVICTNIFIPFPRLPLELRLRILRLSILPRTVEVRFGKSSQAYDFAADVPPILHVCRWSRMEGLQMYEILKTNTIIPKYAYFHPLIDTLYIRLPLNWNDFNAIQAKTFIQNFAQKDIIHSIAIPMPFIVLQSLFDYVKLRKITWICSISDDRTYPQDFACPLCALAPDNRTMLLSMEDYFAHAQAYHSLDARRHLRLEVAMFMIGLQSKTMDREHEKLQAGDYERSAWGGEMPMFEYLTILDWNISEEKFYLKEDA
ncbi:hypothetical protein ONS95_007529 [Cadophora gregata]|uniref:uncharacterized protein n=1 Tax=Cadophora gregata TaxID=51156 RepID=UPI0026DC3594|nr:uncharacterized protein ONS95_007529 [Cadophora gregata]KAK0118647.1 hypothetical protein ONS96_011735 [Cadophora gregata f. sp. sojae]KAK0125905.1 hypothetical protein ONS95_007529 [Cadophora gregata]